MLVSVQVSSRHYNVGILLISSTVIIELILQLLTRRGDDMTVTNTLFLKSTDTSALGSASTFLSSRLQYARDEHEQEICLLKTDDDEIGVMMGWENGISAVYFSG